MRRVSRVPRRAAAARRASARTARAWLLSVWLRSERGTRAGRERWLTCYKSNASVGLALRLVRARAWFAVLHRLQRSASAVRRLAR